MTSHNNASLSEVVEKSLRVFELILEKYRNRPLIFSFSGGKDSTTLILLFLEWAYSRPSVSKKLENVPIYILFNDTYSELLHLRELAVHGFREFFYREFKKVGLEHVTFHITLPEAVDNFYWRMFLRGYPAPTFKFRWCVELLKIKPTRNFLEKLKRERSVPLILFSGVRKDESAYRSKAIDRRAVSQESVLLNSEIIGVVKVAPLIHWSEMHVWKYLTHFLDSYGDGRCKDLIANLLKLYGIHVMSEEIRKSFNGSSRYGCWHCTLAKYHYGICVLAREFSSKYLYLEAVRILYRIVSDISELRENKNWGYSRKGALSVEARALLYHLLNVVEEIIAGNSGRLFYALDEIKLQGNGHTRIPLRELLKKIYIDLDVSIVQKLDKAAYRKMRNIDKIKSRGTIETITKMLKEKSPAILKRYLIFDKDITTKINEIIDLVYDEWLSKI